MKSYFNRACATLAMIAAGPAFAQDRTVLPIPAPVFTGVIAEEAVDSTPMPFHSVRPPEGAPNILLFMSDDTGFAMASTFGGPVPTPNFQRLAMMGQRYNRFHTTAICSPSRAALLTGRNHHNAGVGYLSDLRLGFPGYGGAILPETATIAQMLRLNGYSTAMIGKHHNTPADERSEAGPFDNWPTGLGFEYFYGFNAGDSDQFAPNLYRGTSRVDPDEGGIGNGGKMLDRRLADDLIRWVHNQKAGAPDKPFLIYYAPGSTHAPHQAPAEYIARFKGQFDLGWDEVRAQTLKRQIAAGIVPKGTKLTPRPAEIPAWASLSAEDKAYAARGMEVAAAQLAYQDEQFGRVLDELERMGELDHTLVSVIIGDNGASAEGSPKGAFNELRAMGADDENEVYTHANIDKLGGPMSYGNYAAGWALAMNAPLRWSKQYASMLGGIRDGMILSWPGHVAHPGAVCGQFGHLIDIVPTVLEATHLPAPTMVLGTAQKAIDGQSLLSSLNRCEPAKPRTQYFEMGGKVGLYQDGWFLSGEDGRLSWEMVPRNGAKPALQWSLYDLDHDFSQSTDLAAKDPARVQAMIATWRDEARRNNVFPLFHTAGRGRATPAMMKGSGRKQFNYWGKDVSLPASAEPRLIGRSFTLDADIVLDKADASGVVLALGSHSGGWSLFLDEGHPTFVWARSTDPAEIIRIRADATLPKGATTLRMRFAVEGRAGPAELSISSGTGELARGRLPSSILMPSGNTETLDTGRDIGVPVTDYRTPHGMLDGDISRIRINLD
ncbi:arylsulfatase [Sphingobium sp. AP49]|uniref:arylsulfatase n=1 Tax=Sphingobium sp. AP49 TaxID=1144307 RepID=UPI00026ED0D7|nr:arylsulfatase [Sphingobium sp. AP49]WHO40933.1 arylsulfatase [Sphingobium sp. AP49]